MARIRKSSRLTDRDFIRSLQLVRLNGLPSGEYEPLSNREEMYLRLVRAGLPVDVEDFVVSGALLLLEAEEGRMGAEDFAAPPHDRC